MQEEKKQVEILLMDYFRSCYAEFPTGKAVPSESPDFIVRMKNTHLLGIELTRLNPANAIDPSHEHIKDIEFRERLILRTQELFKHHSEMNLFVKFLFSEKKKLAREKELITAVQLSNLIRNAVKGKKANSFFKISLHKSDLPDGITGLLIVHHPKLETDVWERSNNLGVSNDVVDDIRRAIHKKDEKLRLYQKQRLNYYWLLITTDRLRGGKIFNLPNEIKMQQFDSRFQHVFLFDLIKSKVYELL